jgi:adenine-specific DNA-methyltransferase
MYNPIEDLHGQGEAADNLARLAVMFPDAVADGRLDLEVLRGLLGEDVEPAGSETSGLRWVGMAEARRLSTLPANGTLLPRSDESVDWDSTRNIVIEGDNLEVLRLLRRGYTNEVDVIYIDPPYNTGNDFIYDDRRASTIAEHEADAGLRDEVGATQVGSGSVNAEERRLASARHAKWLSMMYPRLLVAHSLLKETGVLIAAIDDNEHARLKLLLDRVFGAENFISNVVWDGARKNDSQFVSNSADYMLIYAKNASSLANVRWREPKEGVDDVFAAGEAAWRKSGHDPAIATRLLREWYASQPKGRFTAGITNYNTIDDEGCIYYGDSLRKPQPTGSSRYDLIHPVTGKPVRMHPNGWVFSQETMAEKNREGRILFGADHTTMAYYKRYLTEAVEQVPKSVFMRTRRSASQRLDALLDSSPFPFPKDSDELARWFKMIGSNDALILDFFAGSGSTGQAVMDLNALDGGTRRYMLVQLGEKVGTDEYETIADITRERLRRAGKKIAENQTLASAHIDLGFRSYRLGSSNIKPWDGTGELNLLESVDNLVEGRSTDDLLVEMMLRLGIELTTPVETREVAGSKLYNLGGGTLYAYFGDNVTTEHSIEVARALVQWRDKNPVDSDVTIVVRDTGFVDSSAKLNLDAAAKQAGFTNFRSI